MTPTQPPITLDEAVAMPAQPRGFFCTKCGSSECKEGTLALDHPPCGKCGYLGFAEDRGFDAEHMRSYATAQVQSTTVKMQAEIDRLIGILTMNEMAFNNNKFVLEQREASNEKLHEINAAQAETIEELQSALSRLPAPEVQAEPFARLIVERVYHEYENSAKEDTVGYLTNRFTALRVHDLPEGAYALYTTPQPAIKESSVNFLPHDDHLRFVQRVLESDAPKSDRDDAAQMVRDLRRSVFKESLVGGQEPAALMGFSGLISVSGDPVNFPLGTKFYTNEKRTALEQYDLDQSADYRKGYEDGRLKGFDVGQRYATDAATPQPAPKDVQTADPFELDKLESIVDRYLDDYEMNDGEHRTHTPTEFERFLLKDAFLGLLVDEEWDKEWGTHIDMLVAAKDVQTVIVGGGNAIFNPSTTCIGLHQSANVKEAREWASVPTEPKGGV